MNQFKAIVIASLAAFAVSTASAQSEADQSPQKEAESGKREPSGAARTGESEGDNQGWTGQIDSIDLDKRMLVVDDLAFKIPQGVDVRAQGDEYARVYDLEVGDRVGVMANPEDRVAERIILLPADGEQGAR